MESGHKSYGTASVNGQTPLRVKTSIWTYTFMTEIVTCIRNLFNVNVISIFSLYNSVFLNTTVITDTLPISIISSPCPKSIDVDSGLLEMNICTHHDPAWLTTNTVSYSLVTDINYIITAIITPDHKIRDVNSYISQLPKGKRITNVIWTVLCWFLRIGVVFLPVFSHGGRFVYHRVRDVCLQTDKTQCFYIHEVMRASKWSEKLKYRFTGLSAFQFIP